MRIQEDIKLDFSDVLIKPKRSTLESRKDAVLTRTFKFKHSTHKWAGVPIIAANMDHTGTYEMNKALYDYAMLTAICKFTTYAPLPNAIKTIGLDQNLDEIDYDLQWVCLDVANGYTERFMSFVEKMRQHEATKNSIIIAGNVCTPEATEQIILAGADIVKIGIGPGSVCTTRKMTGVGYPQLSATIECADAAHGLGGHIITDGGCTVVGDIAKAFGAGADFVMLGGMLAGHDEGEGTILNTAHLTNDFDVSDDTIWDDILNTGGIHNRYVRKKFVEFYGMSSKEAQDKHNGGMANYKASEGKVVRVPYRGPVKNTIEEILGGLRSACTYAGAKTLKDLPKCTTFVRVNRQLNEIFSNT